MNLPLSKMVSLQLACAFFVTSGFGVARSWAQEPGKLSKTEQVSCSTLVQWYSDPAEAKKLSMRTGKPLLILQLSGDFQNENFT